MRQRFGVMAGRREFRASESRLHLAAQHRNIHRRQAVSRRREQADNHPLAGHMALVVKGFHPDHIHMNAAVNRGALIGLGDHRQLGLADKRAHLFGQRSILGPVLEYRAIGIPQHAEPAGFGGQALLCPLALMAVLAIAEEGEMVIAQPFQEFPGLDNFTLCDGRGSGFQIRNDIADLGIHFRPILDRRPDIHKHLLQAAGQSRQCRRIGLLADFDMHKALGLGAAVD